MSNSSQEVFSPEKYIEGHKSEISCVASGCISLKESTKTFLITGGRDKKVLIWNIDYNAGEDLTKVAVPKYTLTGHNHHVTDLCLSQNNEVFLSSSWDKSMRLWNIVDGSLKQTFFGSRKEINACGISIDSKVIYSAGFDNKTTIWNTLGQMKAESAEPGHIDAVTKLRVSPNPENNYFVTVGWDGFVKIWSNLGACQASIRAHDSPIYALDINKNGQYFVTGGKDGKIKLWKYSDLKAPVKEWDINQPINDLKISPVEHWIAVATDSKILLIDYNAQEQSKVIIAISENIKQEKTDKGAVISEENYKVKNLVWDPKSLYLFAGCDNGLLKVLKVNNNGTIIKNN